MFVFRINEENTLSVHVTQGQENVEDADDVQFEIWKADSKENMTKTEYTVSKRPFMKTVFITFKRM
ncbi:hypothetical protein BTO30_11275 [Domibacillus antri]|uniref:YtkA-like domain-containing protein n=2 Tax=Domibacillus antri TaxID=1714264 RepID=A0A1Q8Q493_9BACI|nr:FixH family protein [Domibacillus antri]OLN22147.1 hypothetical protein BTO30_11275 [Domibacillus antri]